MTHQRAVGTMVLATLLWSIAGIVTRQLASARSFEVTFWRSVSCALGLLVILPMQRGPRALLRDVRLGGHALWISGVCWSIMFTAFMVALTLTTVANVLVTMALGPMFTALLARVFLNQTLPLRSWAAIVVAGVGIAWMYGAELAASGASHWVGTLVALSVPVAAALMWTLLQFNARKHPQEQVEMAPAVLIGAVLSSLCTLPLAMPWAADGTDVAWLVLLGVVQLAVPCVLAVAAGRVLPAPEAALLGLLEIVFGVTWAWLGTDEAPTTAVIGGGALVLGALAANEGWALRERWSATRAAP
jgi:drug/metabolite transporter (DMT)-like permease